MSAHFQRAMPLYFVSCKSLPIHQQHPALTTLDTAGPHMTSTMSPNLVKRSGSMLSKLDADIVVDRLCLCRAWESVWRERR